MNNIFKILTALILLAGITSCQLDRSKRPEAGPAPEIKLDKPQTFELENGLKVIVVENHKVPRVSFQLTLENDPILEKEAVGYTDAAASLLRMGTKNRTKAEIDEEIDFIGASLYTRTSGIFGMALTEHTESFLEVMADIALNPTFPQDEVEKYIKQSVSGLSTQETDPNAMSSNIAQLKRYGKDHPYGEITTKESIQKLTRHLCVDYYNTYYRPNNSYLVIVGDINKENAEQLAKKYFGNWEKGEIPTHEYEMPKQPEGNQVSIVNKDGAVQSVIKITYPIDMKPGSEDAIPAKIMNEILGGGVFSGRLMQNLREDKGYTYGARSQLSSDDLVGYFNAGAEVATEVTDSAVHEFLFEMQRMVEEKVSDEHLAQIKKVNTGAFARAMESPETIARFALNIERYNLPEDYYSTYLQKLNAVTKDQVLEMAKKYIKPENAQIVVVGDKSILKKTLKQYDSDGKIQFYDVWGNELEDNSTVPTDITAEVVIEKYIDAIGGKSNLEAVKTIKQLGEMDVQNQRINTEISQKAPNKFLNETKMNGMLIQKQVYDGEKGYMGGMQGDKEITGDELEELKYQAILNAELKYDELGYKLDLVGSEEVEGANAYKIKVTSPAGDISFDYYDADSGLKVMSKATKETPQGTFDQTQMIQDYKKVNGVLYPHKIVIKNSMMPEPMVLKITDIKVNIEIPDSQFVK
jgi:zinc protease